ncbi:hypothetical protein [Mesorhizobium jarvisii]|uniref:hypothetical protein n=1 Tax=Mesorhizobium jarvisii TaxID=1777867 RepID=UPI001F0B5209|nr:hypothetical protein [Mesorhizobium jarvisii]MCH4554860.1 hypothetical protein [Mesorhizobium jarvisii]
MSSIYDWSTTAATNATSDTLINWAEGQAPSTVNGSAREMMARVAEFLDDIGGAITAGGTANALTVTANSAFSAYANGLMLAVRIATDNTGATTLNANGIGAKSVRKFLPTGESALIGGEMQQDGVAKVIYLSWLNSAAGGWLLLNPTDVAATTTGSGIVELATNAEAIARTDAVRAITPANLAAAIGPASSTDNTVARYDGTSGKIQSSGVTIDDSDNLVAANVTAGAFISSSNAFGTSSAGTLALRPNGVFSTTGQMTVASTGAVTTNGAITVNGAATVSGTLTVGGVTVQTDTGAANAALALGAIGTYALLGANPGADITPGQVVAGSGLRYTHAGGFVGAGTIAPSGNWKCMGVTNVSGFGSSGGTSLFLRVS